MAKADGWVKIHRKILATELTASQFKFFVGAILLAKSPKSKDSGLVDLSLRQFARELKMDYPQVWRRAQELVARGMITLLPKPQKGFVINNYHYYQTGQVIAESNQLKNIGDSGELPDRSLRAITVIAESNQSIVTPVAKKDNKKNKNIKTIKKGNATKPSPDPVIGEIFNEMRSYFGYPNEIDQDPIPNYGKEGKAIKRMRTRGFSAKQIFDYWKAKVVERGEFVSMVWVNEDIGKKGGQGGAYRGHSKQASTEELKDSIGRPLD
ncbi:hypothetical protein ES703_110571 [subsurface metagenome]